MSWTEAEVIVRVAPRATASIAVLKGGIVKLTLSLSETFMKELGDPKKADVQFGTAENLGKLRLVPSKTGKFELKPIGVHAFRILIACPKEIGDGAREGEPCTVDERTDKHAILSLPLAAWLKQVTPPEPARIGGNVTPKTPPPPPQQETQHHRVSDLQGAQGAQGRRPIHHRPRDAFQGPRGHHGQQASAQRRAAGGRP